MIDNTFFSITIPAYKSIYLAKAIQSCLKQTYNNFELIIVDDASPNDIASIVRQYSDKRIRYFKNEVGFGAEHVVDNWNRCLQYAKGEYFICMGDDDELESTCLEEYLRLIHKYPNLKVYHARSVIIDEESNITQLLEDKPEYESAYSIMWHRMFKDRKQFIGDWLFDTTELRKIGGFYFLPFAWNSDFITVYICAKNGGVANTQAPCFRYRMNRYSITRDRMNFRGKIRAHRLAHSWHKEFLKEKPSDYIDGLYWKDLTAKVDYYFSREISLEIGHSFQGHLLKLVLLSWNIVKQNEVTWKELFKAYFFIIQWWVMKKV